MRRARWLALGLGALVACGGEGRPPSVPREAAPVASASAPAKPDVTLSVLALNDLHGRITALPVFAGYVNNVREARKRDGGGVVVLDAGDMFQGSLESNLTEGSSVFAAYRALGVSAVALGNHEFDFGPVGESRGDGDPQGALKARLLEATFPVLSANLVTQSGDPPRWPGLSPSALIEIRGVKVGIVGALTVATPDIVMPAFFSGLDVAPVAPLLTANARALRASGAEVVIGALHLGAECERFDDPHDLSSCSDDREAFDVVEALPPRTLDAVVGGHTHAGVAHYVKGVPVVEAYSRGRAFARVDLVLDGTTHELKGSTLYPPHDLCPNFDATTCAAGDYEGKPVVPDPAVVAAIAPALELARVKRSEALGPELVSAITREHGRESALGNLFVDLLLAHVEGADAAILNGGGLRADLPPGPLSYGSLYEAMPFDNRVAKIRITGGELARVLAVHLSHGAHGIISIAGLSVRARCRSGELLVELRRPTGRLVKPEEVLTVATSDYLATGGDRLFAPAALSKDRVEPDLGMALRDAFAVELGRRPKLDPKTFFDPKRPRLDLPAPRPLECGAQQ
jgi:2',3'-cyclic-nucleotide 2'-phosphodiesterase (5'-nucleotidase family)